MTKKKSLLTLVLAVCLIVPAMFMMTACGHKHTAVTEWSSDATYHWHVCEDEKCQEQLDKAEHTWDAGVITKEATFLEDGEKTYTCSVCKIKNLRGNIFEIPKQLLPKNKLNKKSSVELMIFLVFYFR